EDNSAPATQQFCGEEPVPHWADAKYPTQASSCTRTVVGGNLKLMPRVMCTALSRMLSQGSHAYAVAIPNVQGLSGLPLAFQHPLSQIHTPSITSKHRETKRRSPTMPVEAHKVHSNYKVTVRRMLYSTKRVLASLRSAEHR
ncbi:hypothetical protein ATANTOWER_000237, partial [Ataeniobius toweri]|nr:hypothetical protein [Ataeniobius toweri]